MKIYDLSYELSKKIKESYHPDCLIGLLRGACWPARIVADLLETPLGMMEVKYYERGKVAVTGEEPEITQPCPIDVDGKRVLIVDDVSDSGRSLRVAKEHIEENGSEEVRTATLHYKPWSNLEPDFYVEKTDAWIIYQWELGEFVNGLIENNLYSDEEKGFVLARSGVPRSELNKILNFYGHKLRIPT